VPSGWSSCWATRCSAMRPSGEADSAGGKAGKG
jgi:hypothetical protein